MVVDHQTQGGLNAFYSTVGTRASLRERSFTSGPSRQAQTADPCWFPNAPRGSTSNPLAQFTAKDHTRKQLIAQNPEKMARTSTYPFYYRQAEPGRDAKLWAPRRATSHDPYHPGEVLAGWDNAYTHQNTHFGTSSFQYGSFWYDRRLQPNARVFNQTQPGGGWFQNSWGHRP